MADKATKSLMKPDAKCLAVIIYEWLLDEHNKKYLNKRSKSFVFRASDCLEKVYNIGFRDYVLSKSKYTLKEIYNIGYQPIKVKNCIRAQAHKNKGNEFMDAKLYKLAEDEYSKALHLNPRNAIYYLNRAASKIRQGAFMAGMNDCKWALEFDDQYAKAYIWSGLVHALTDNPARAIRCYRKALKIEPENEVCLANIDLINRSLNRSSFKVLQPLFRSSRNFVRRAASNLANGPAIFKKKPYQKIETLEMETKSANLEKFNLGSLD